MMPTLFGLWSEISQVMKTCDSTYAVETSQVYYHTMQEIFTQNGLHPGISMRFETCEVWVRLFKCVSPTCEGGGIRDWPRLWWGCLSQRTTRRRRGSGTRILLSCCYCR